MCIRDRYETNSFWSNWYIGVGGGINIYEGEFDNKTSVGNRIAPALDVSLGKWITPSYGVRPVSYTHLDVYKRQGEDCRLYRQTGTDGNGLPDKGYQ